MRFLAQELYAQDYARNFGLGELQRVRPVYRKRFFGRILDSTRYEYTNGAVDVDEQDRVLRSYGRDGTFFSNVVGFWERLSGSLGLSGTVRNRGGGAFETIELLDSQGRVRETLNIHPSLRERQIVPPQQLYVAPQVQPSRQPRQILQPIPIARYFFVPFLFAPFFYFWH